MSPLNKVTLQRIGYILRYAIPAVSFRANAYGVVQPLISYIRPHGSFRPDHQLTSYRFYPVAGAAGIRSTEMTTSESVQRKNRDINPIGLKFLRSRGFFQEAPCRVWDRVPRSSPHPAFDTFASRTTTVSVKDWFLRQMTRESSSPALAFAKIRFRSLTPEISVPLIAVITSFA